MQTRTIYRRKNKTTATDRNWSKITWLLTCIGVRILSGYVIINHVIWTWSTRSRWGIHDFKYPKVSQAQTECDVQKKRFCSICFLKTARKEVCGNCPKSTVFLCTGKYVSLTIAFFRSDKDFSLLLSIHAVLAGSAAHLAKASSSVIGGYSSLKILPKNMQRNHWHLM